MTAPPLPTAAEWEAMSFGEQVTMTFGLIRYVQEQLQRHLAVRQRDGRPLSAADLRTLDALRLSLDCLRREADDGLEPGSLERATVAAFAALGVVDPHVRLV